MAFDLQHLNALINSIGSTSHCRSLTICPSDPCWEPLEGDQGHISDLEMVSDEEDDSPYMHPSLPAFLSSLTSLKTLRISWHNLDWSLLPDDQLEALMRLINLESLEELQIVAACNFPLDLLRNFSGLQLHLTFTGDVMPGIVTQTPVRLQTLAALSLVGQRNMLTFMEYVESQPGLHAALQGLESLSITCVDDDQFESERNLEVVESFLRLLDGSDIRELSIQDERPNAVIGYTLDTQEFRSLRNVCNIEAHLSIKNPLSPHETHRALCDWLTSLLSNIISSTTLKSLDVTYQVTFQNMLGSLDALVDKMGQLWRELDQYLAHGFLGLEQVNVGFQFYGVGGHERWMEFNADNQPVELDKRGVDCSFWVRDI